MHRSVAGAKSRRYNVRVSPDLVALAVAGTWFAYGFYFKLLRRVPRHEKIVARVFGHTWAPLLARLIGIGEIGIAIWVLTGFAPVMCALVQTCAVVTMNAIELTRARDLLYAWPAMLCANALLLTGAWYLAVVATP